MNTSILLLASHGISPHYDSSVEDALGIPENIQDLEDL
jgi:hypothetical protein